MSHRLLLVIVIAVVAAVPVLGQAGRGSKAPAGQAGQVSKAAAAAKAWTQPRTAWGDPDIQGTWTSDDYIGVPLQRAANAGSRLLRTDEEIATAQTNIQRTAERNAQEFQSPNAQITVNPPGHWGEGARRPALQTSMVVVPEDGRMPELTQEAQQRQAAAAAARQAAGSQGASWEDYSFYIRCISRGLMGSTLPVIYGNGSQIVQGPGHVAIMYEMVHEARIIPLDGSPHPGSNVRSYMGDPRGHWEGNTLVVETTNFLPNRTGIGLNGGGTPTSEELKVTERFTRTASNTMNYQATIEDPKTFTKPFTIGYPITQEPGYQIFEYACHEGNLAMHNSLSGSRAQERQ
jgi:hypothetical protein